jgi:hypothetical protein
MVWPMIIAAGATLIAANQQSRAAQSAADTTAAATREAAGAQQQQFERQVQLQEPWRKAGEQALNKLVPLATEYTPFGTQQFQQDPGYAFRLSEGQKALERSAAARGGLMSGSALKAAQQYGQEMGSQEYMNAFKRYQMEREAQLNPLQSLANVGQTGTTRLGEAAQTYGTNVGNLGINQAQLAAQAGLSRASSYGNAVNQLAYLGGRYMENDQNQPTFGYSGG